MAEYVALDVLLCAIVIVVLAVLIRFASSFMAWVAHKIEGKKRREGVRSHVRKKSS